MKLIIPIAALAAAFAMPAAASAREVTFEAQLSSYGGNAAYAVVYVVKDGAYQGTVWMAGGKSKYYRHLRDWSAATGGAAAEIDGITGASVGSGRTLTVTVDLADALIDAGYEIRIDTAVEDMRDNPADVVVPLTSAGAAKPTAGRGYVKSFTYTM